jgi:ATP-binding cassette subfamily F protein 3
LRDRHLLRATTDELWLVADHRVTPFDGDLDDYRAWVLDRNRRGYAADESTSAVSPPPIAACRSARKRKCGNDARRANRSYPSRRRSKGSPADGRKDALDDWLSTSDAYADDARPTGDVDRAAGQLRGRSRGSNRNGSSSRTSTSSGRQRGDAWRRPFPPARRSTGAC